MIFHITTPYNMVSGRWKYLQYWKVWAVMSFSEVSPKLAGERQKGRSQRREIQLGWRWVCWKWGKITFFFILFIMRIMLDLKSSSIQVNTIVVYLTEDILCFKMSSLLLHWKSKVWLKNIISLRELSVVDYVEEGFFISAIYFWKSIVGLAKCP
jgi:hypothetical protein